MIFFLSDNGASAEQIIRGDGHDRSAPPGSAKTFLCHRPGLVQRCQHALPAAQILGARRRHHHAADRALAAGDRRPRRAAPRSGPFDRPGADAPGAGRRQLAGNIRRPAGPAAARQEPRAGVRQGRHGDARLFLVVSRLATARSASATGSWWPPRTRPGSCTICVRIARNRTIWPPANRKPCGNSKRRGPAIWKSFAHWRGRICPEAKRTAGPRRSRKGNHMDALDLVKSSCWAGHHAQ